VSHIATYTLAFVPALVWIGLDLNAAAAVGLGLLIALPHLVQDDGRPVSAYLSRIKRTDADVHSLLFMAVDQSLHLVALFGVALLASV
jgi:hypothetical protein